MQLEKTDLNSLKVNILKYIRFCILFVFFACINHAYVYPQSLSGSLVSKFIIFNKGENYSGTINTRLDEIAWKGERIINQFIIWTPESPVSDITYQVTDLIGVQDTIPASNVTLRSVHYVKADQFSKGCSEYDKRDFTVFDELGDVLTETPITTLSPDDPVKIWLTIDIPIRINTGDYCGSLSIQARGKTELVFEIKIRVTDWTLPAREDWTFHLDLWQYPTRVIDRYNDDHPDQKLKYWSEEHYAMLKQMYLILADKGQKVITAHIKEGALGCPSMVQWIKTKDNSWKYDFSIFDQYVDSLMSWGINKQISCQSPVGWNSDEIPYFDEISQENLILEAPVGSSIYQERWNDFLSKFRHHLIERGLFEKTVLFMDEIGEDKLEMVIGMIKNNDPEWKIGLAGFHQLPAMIDTNIYDLSLHYIIPFESVNQSRNNTFYFSCNPPFPNNFVASDAEPAVNAFIGWYAYSQHINGFLRWAYDDWLDAEPYEMRIGSHTSGDFCLIYRSSNDMEMKFYSSIRLELMRDGIQDYEKLIILEDYLKKSSKTSDNQSLLKLENKLKEFSAMTWGAGDITLLVESAQELIKDIIAGK